MCFGDFLYDKSLCFSMSLSRVSHMQSFRTLCWAKHGERAKDLDGRRTTSSRCCRRLRRLSRCPWPEQVRRAQRSRQALQSQREEVSAGRAPARYQYLGRSLKWIKLKHGRCHVGFWAQPWSSTKIKTFVGTCTWPGLLWTQTSSGPSLPRRTLSCSDMFFF